MKYTIRCTCKHVHSTERIKISQIRSKPCSDYIIQILLRTHTTEVGYLFVQNTCVDSTLILSTWSIMQNLDNTNDRLVLLLVSLLFEITNTVMLMYRIILEEESIGLPEETEKGIENLPIQCIPYRWLEVSWLECEKSGRGTSTLTYTFNSSPLFVAAVTDTCGLSDEGSSQIERDNEKHAAARTPLA